MGIQVQKPNLKTNSPNNNRKRKQHSSSRANSPLSTHTPGDGITIAGSCIEKKRTRGITWNLKIAALPFGQKLPLEFNRFGQPIGDYATMFSNCLGKIVRTPDNAPIYFSCWDVIPEGNREKMYMLALEKFEFQETWLRKEKIIQKMRTKFSTHKHNLKAEFYDPYNSDEERRKHYPPRTLMNQWVVFIRCLSTPKKQKDCAQNKNNRAKLTINHTSGTKSYAIRRAKATVENIEPSDWQMFCMTHKRKDGSMVDAAQEIKTWFETLSTQLKEQSSTPINEDEIFRQVRGPERHGRVRGYRLGPTPTTVFGSTPSRVELISQLKEANNRNEEMKQKMQELERKIEEDRQELERKMEEDRQKLAAFMEEIRNSRMPAPPQEISDMQC